MGQDLVRFAAEDEARQASAAMRGHADKIAFFLLGDGEDLLMDIVALYKRGVQRNSGGACEMIHYSEDPSGLCLVVPQVCLGQDFFRGPVGAVRAAGEFWVDM